MRYRATCAACHQEGSYAGRGLCTSCHARAIRGGTLEDWPRAYRRSTDTAEDFLFMYEHGMAVDEIADRLELSREGLLVALRRRGVPLTWSRETGWRMVA